MRFMVQELVTLSTNMPDLHRDWAALLESVQEETARSFIARCLAPEDHRATVAQLLEDPFLKVAR